MAIIASIYKVNVSLSNFNTHYYEDFNLTIAQHPSENVARMMFRLLSFLHSAHKDLKFTRGLSSTDEPELWQKDYSGDIVHWIELGLPDEKRIRVASSKSQNVTIYTYHYKRALDWFEKNKDKNKNNKKLKVFHFLVFENGPLDKFVSKTMNLSCTIEDNIIYLGNDQERIGIEVIEAVY